MFRQIINRTGLTLSWSQSRRFAQCGNDLKSILKTKIEEEQKKVKEFRKSHGKDKVCDVLVEQVYGGMRGIRCMVTETSLLDPEKGIRFRGKSIPDCQKCLPKAECGEQPLPEGIFWLLLTGNIPSEEQVKSISKEWADRSEIPKHVVNLLNSFPCDVHPMAQLSSAMCAMNTESKFSKAFQKGVKKSEYWEYTYEDSMNLIAKLPMVAAIIYRNLYSGGGCMMPADPDKDWSQNFAEMLGCCDDPQFTELLRLYLTIHCDHEGGNVSAHTVHLVGSALSDVYLAYAAGMCGLAGPLHGLANQQVLIWLENLRKEVGDKYTKDQLKAFVEKTLKSGQVIPGYGHAVLRATDPRYVCQREFAQKYLPDDPVFKIVSDLYEIVPPILKATGKVQNPWPNVDAHSGVLLQYYGLTQTNYYTVLFAASRALGVLASLIWDRALGLPIERPKSMTTEAMMKMFEKKGK